MQKLLTVREVAEILSISPHSVYSLVAKKKIPHVRVCERTIRFESSEFEQWLKSISSREERRQ